MQVNNAFLASSTPANERKAGTAGAAPFSQVFERAASKLSASGSTPSGETLPPQGKSPAGTQAVACTPQPLFSTARHGPPGSPPGFQEALYSLVNQPGLTNAERIQICMQSAAALAYAQNGPPEMAAKFPAYADAYTPGFNPVRALLSTVNDLAGRYPNIGQVGQEWAAAQGSVAAKTAVWA
ncbi:MAG: hypothetical protein ACYC2R_00015 [Burkholderiales bacterium]